MAHAFSLRRRLERGEFDDFANMARALRFTRARTTQLMDLLLIAPRSSKLCLVTKDSLDSSWTCC